MRIFDEKMIRKHLDVSLVYEQLRKGFIAHSQRKVVSSVCQFRLDKGSLHIKGGMIKGDPHLFVKLASGFSENWIHGLPTGDGCILAFSSSTGLLEAILFDNGYLTDLRTALAVRLCIESFRPEVIESVGILGTGVQAHLCAQQQFFASQCRNILIWGRNTNRTAIMKSELELRSFHVTEVDSPNALLEKCDLVVTTTSSQEPLLSDIPDRKTKLIVAIGADEIGKQELDPCLVTSASMLIADDVTQSLEIGEFQYSYRSNLIKPGSIYELGTVITEKLSPSTGLTICGLSGLPIQDVQIAKVILEAPH